MPTPSNSTPTSIMLTTEYFSETPISKNGDVYREFTLYVNGQEYKKLPLDANVREPNPDKSRPYKDMVNTLNQSPEDFLENNLGISVVASEVKQVNANKFELSFQSGTGILNGGHTQLAILNCQSNSNISKALVRLIVKEKQYTPERLAEIAAAQNSSSAVKEYSLAEKKGLFAKMKSSMDANHEKHIIWYEGKIVPNGIGMTPDDLIALINMFNVELNQSRYNNIDNQPTESSSAKKSTFNKWSNEDNLSSYEMIYPLIDDIIDLYEYAQLEITKGTNVTSTLIFRNSKNKSHKPLVFSGKVPEYITPKQFLYPFLFAFRANIYLDKANRKIGWFVDNKKLLQKVKKELCTKLKNELKTKSINEVGKSSNLYQLLYSIVLNAVLSTKKPLKTYEY